MRIGKFMKLLLGLFLLFICYSGFGLASDKPVFCGNLCVDFKKALKTKNFLVVDDLYERLLANFEKEKKLNYVNWSTMIGLTKSYEKFCIEQGKIDKIIIVINRLLQKCPPETFHGHLCLLKEHLNPNKLSLGKFLQGLEQIQKKDTDLFLDPQDLLFFNTYKYFVVDHFESLRQQANKDLFLNNYEKALDLYMQLVEGIQQGDFLLSEEDKAVVLSEIEVSKCLVLLRQSEQHVESGDQIVTFVNYFQAKKKHEKLLLSLFNSFKDNTKKVCSLDLGRNLFNLADFYYMNPCEGKAEEILNIVIERTKTFDRTFKLGFLKLLAISFERKDFVLLEKLLDKSSFFQGDDLEYSELCLYQGILFYYQKKFDEAQAYIKLSINHPEALGVKMSLALQYLGYALLDYSETQTGKRKEVLLEEAYNTFLLLLNNWDKVEGLLGCFYSKVKQIGVSEWNLGIKLISENLGKLSLNQKQLLFNLNLIAQFFPDFSIEKDIQTNNFYHVRSVIMQLSCDISNDARYLIKSFSHSLDKIIVSLLKQEDDKKVFGIETFIQKFLNNHMEKDLEQCLTYSSLVSGDSSLAWYISLIKDFYAKNFRFSDIELNEYTQNCSSIQQDILLCIKVLKMLSSQSKNKILDFLENHITHEISYPQDLLKLLFLDIASEQNLISKKKDILLWTRKSYFSEEMFFKTFPLYSYIRGDKEAINHLHEFIALFSESRFMPVALYFLGIHQKDAVQAIHYLTTALEDYINITPHSYNQNPFTYFFYKTKLKLSLLLIQRCEKNCLVKAIELLEGIKEDFVCLQHPLIKEYKERHSTIKFELDTDYLLMHTFFKLGETRKLEQHLTAVLKKYTPFCEDPEINRLLYFLWSLQKKLADDMENRDVYKACEDVMFYFIKNVEGYLVEENIQEIILPLNVL